MAMPPIEVLDALRKRALINVLIKYEGYNTYTVDELDDMFTIEEIADRIRQVNGSV